MSQPSSSAGPGPIVSAIVPSYNSRSTLGRVLEALLAQRVPLHEIVVADSSDDPAAKQLLLEFAGRGVSVVALPTRTPPSAARNAGARAATGDWFAFVDADAPPKPDWSAHLADAIRSGNQAGGGSLTVHADQQRSAIAWAQYFLQFNEFMPVCRARRVAFTPSANLFCERSLFLEVGGFPDLRAAEDVAFGQAVRARQPFHFFPDLTVDHIFRTEMGAIARNQHLLGSYVYVWRNANNPGFALRGWRARILWPFVAAAKGVRIGCRVLATRNPRYIFALLRSLPWFAWGIWHWGRGFGGGPGLDVPLPGASRQKPLL